MRPPRDSGASGRSAGRRARSRVAAAVALGTVAALWTVPAGAQGGGPGLTGSVDGRIQRLSRITVTIVATHPDGWRNLDSVAVQVVRGKRVLDEIDFSQYNESISANGEPSVLTGTPGAVVGTYLAMTGLDVQTSTGGSRLGLTMGVRVVRTLPSDVAFRLVAIDDFGRETSVLRHAVPPEIPGGGFSWGTLALAVAAALFAGGFVGNVFASHRRTTARPSVYTAVQRRIEEDRART